MRIFNDRAYGIEESIIASGYPMSLDVEGHIGYSNYINESTLKRAERLGTVANGTGHDCFLKGIIVQADITAPQYWWLQYGRYHFADIISSQSKMHKIIKMDIKEQCNEYVAQTTIDMLEYMICEHEQNPTQLSFQRIMANVPMGLELTARITSNYLQEKTIYKQRKAHRLEEWKVYCEWLETLPSFKQLCLDTIKGQNKTE